MWNMKPYNELCQIKTHCILNDSFTICNFDLMNLLKETQGPQTHLELLI